MKEYQQVFMRQLKILINLLAIYSVGWGFTPYKSVFLGLLLGTVLSVYLLWGMYSKVKRFGNAISEKRRTGSLGTLQRMAVAVLAALIATRYPETFHLYSVILGLMTFYIVIMIDSLYQSIRKKAGKRGE